MSFFIISVDGGGIRGTIPALLLQELDAQLGNAVASRADLYAGSSTGSLVSVGLAGGVEIGEVVHTYLSPARCAQIFTPYVGSPESERDHPRYRLLFEALQMAGKAAEMVGRPDALSVLEALFFPAYTHSGLRQIVLDHHLPYKIGDIHPYVFVPAMRITADWGERWEATAFHNLPDAAGLDCDPETLTVDAVLSTISTPMGFPPYTIDGELYVDGGVMAKNPTLFALAAATRAGLIGPGTEHPYEEVSVLSLGTGYSNSSYPPEGSSFPPPFGLLGWEWPSARGHRSPPAPFPNAMSDGVAEVTHYQVEALLPADSYCRIQIDLGDHGIALNDCGEIEKLKALAEQHMRGPDWSRAVEWLRRRLGV